MEMLRGANDGARQLSVADLGPDDVVVTWLLRRFEELSSESFGEIVLLVETMMNPDTLPEERAEIYETIREILFPHLIGNVCLGNLGDEQTATRVQERTNWIGNKVKEYRENKNLTQSELAEKSGLRQPQISRLEAGVHSPSFKTLQKLANALDIAVGDLDPSN